MTTPSKPTEIATETLDIVVGGGGSSNLIAEGTPDDPIIFTSTSDDTAKLTRAGAGPQLFTISPNS